MFERAHEVPNGATLRTDVCIVGSGAAGIALALGLENSGKQVLLLEAGELERDRSSEEDTFAIEHLGQPYGNPATSRGRYFGGNTNLWFGRIAMLDAIDFEVRPWVPHSGWPIERDALGPWVEKAARILAVPNLEKMQQDSWAGHPAHELLVERGGGAIGCFVWADGLFMAPYNRSPLQASRNVKLLFGATTLELVPNESSRAIASLSAVGPEGNRFTIEAGSYVLAAGGLENPRLLLASTARSQHGIGNEHGLVGRFYMDHPRSQGLATLDLSGLPDAQIEQLKMMREHFAPDHGGKIQLRLTFPPAMQRAEGLLNHALHADFASDIHGTGGYQAAMRLKSRLAGKNTDAIGRELTTTPGDDVLGAIKGAPELLSYGVRRLRKGGSQPERMYLHDQMEQEPDPESRVTVDWSRKDRWGLPGLRLNWRIGESTYRSQLRMHQLFKDVLERSGIHGLQSPLLEGSAQPPLVEMSHPSGTTKMGATPSTGVVDPELRVHGVENLYVAGSSTFPTVGHANSTLMIVALAARLADTLRR